MGAHTSQTGRAEPWPLVEQAGTDPINIRLLAVIGFLMMASALSGAFLGLLIYGWVTYRS